MVRQQGGARILAVPGQGPGVEAAGVEGHEEGDKGKRPICGNGPGGGVRGGGTGEDQREAEKIPSCSSSASSSRVYLEHEVEVYCDVCGGLKPASDVCFDVVGCVHMFCFGCLSLSPARGDVVACPVSGCRAGFLDQVNGGGARPAPEKEEEEAAVAALAVALAAEEMEKKMEEEGELTYFCSICMERKPLEECFLDLRGCDHVFCGECVAGYVKAKVGENAVAIGCPEPGCGEGRLEPEACRAVIPEAVFKRWGVALCEAAVGEEARFYCPYRDCSALLWRGADEEEGEGGRSMTDAQCLHCGRVCCAQCRVPWHTGLTCAEYRRRAADEEGEEKVMEMAKKRRWQKCPKCGFVVERIDGCVFIRCRCKHCFCYRCASTMDPTDQKHYCSKCHLAWDNEQG